jgi:hypothetical protein
VPRQLGFTQLLLIASGQIGVAERSYFYGSGALLVKSLVAVEVGPPARSSNHEFRFDPDNVFTKSAPEPLLLMSLGW